MRVGLVCPYSLDVAGGVQRHVLDLAEHLLADGHHVRVLAPASPTTPVPPVVDAVGGSLAIPYNGSVARVSFGPVTASRVRAWRSRGGFDVLHLHQPSAPSLSLLALRGATVPVVATWHMAQERSRALRVARVLLGPTLGRIDAHVAVSEDARRTVVDHLGADPVVVPNGVDVAALAGARVEPAWAGARFGGPPTVVLVGRFDEPRKGAGVLAAALPALVAAHPGLRLLVAGRGDGAALAASAGAAAGAVTCLGEVDEDDKRALMASADVVVAPQTGGESFGIVLVEAMAAGTPLVASDLPAFARVLDGGRLGTMSAARDPADLARAVSGVLADPAAAAARAAAASVEVARYDWSVVAASVREVYTAVLEGCGSLPAAPGPPGRLGADADHRGDRRRGAPRPARPRRAVVSPADPAGSAQDPSSALRLGEDWAPGADGMPYRRAARALVVAGAPGAERLLMVRGHDVDQTERSWWFTPGGGIEPGEEPLDAAVREVAEESGIVLDPGAVVGPVASRSAVFDFLARRCRQDELFFYARLATAPEQIGELARAGWTEVERATLDELRWFALDELAALAATGSEVYPARLVEVLAPLVAGGWGGHTLDLGREGPPDVP